MNSSKILVLSLIIFLVLAVKLQAATDAKLLNAKQITKALAVHYAKKEVDGRVLKIDIQPEIFQVKILQETGRVVNVKINRRTGKIMSKPHIEIKGNQ